MTHQIIKTDGAKLTFYSDGPDWDGAPAATIGDFSCDSEESGVQALQQAISHAKQSGLRQLIGPMSGDTWHSYRFVSQSDGSDAFLMEPTNPPHALSAFQAAGFTEIGRHFSARVALRDVVFSAGGSSDAFEIETWDGSDPEALFRQVYDLSVQAFSNNAFYKPISEADFLAMYMPIVPMLKPDLIFFARRLDGALAGFLFGIPNYAEGPKPQTVILKTYASLERGAGRQMVNMFHKGALDLGYDQAIHALIHEDNQSAERSAVEGATIFRRYSLLGLRLDG